MEKVRNYSSTYLYSKGNYETPLLNAIMTCNRIDKNSREFQGIVDDVKRRQTTSVLLEVMMKNNVVLMMNSKPLSRSFSVFTAKDPKDRGELKVFIDCTNLFKYENGFYSCGRIDVLSAYLISAMDNMIYYTDPRRIVSNNIMVSSSTDAYVSLFCYILDYLRINGYAENKAKIMYIVGMFYQTTLLQKPISDSTRALAAKVAGITPREAKVVDILYDEEHLLNLKTLIDQIVKVFKFKDFTTELFVDKWIYLYGVSTIFAPELYTCFSTMLTDAYSGTYLNQQKTIEKCVGREMIEYTNALFKVGHDSFSRLQ